MFIRSERLFLRPGWPEDYADLLDLISDASVVRSLATVPWPYTVEDAKAFIERPRDKLLPHFFITLPTADGAKLIGSIGLGRDGNDAELGYWIAHNHWGQGYATEAVRAVLSLARTLGHQRIVATHFADNLASGRVLRKAGLNPTGGSRLRHSIGRGGEALALTYAVNLGVSSDCDDDVPRNDDGMRAA